MENAIVGELHDAIRRIETEIAALDETRAQKKRELRAHKRALDSLSGKQPKERKARNTA